MKIVKEFQESGSCSYLKDHQSLTHYKLLQHCSMQESQNFIQRGYRRFGHLYFRPECPECKECQSIKIDVENYTFSKSAKRVLKKGGHLRVVIQQPTLTKEHLQLFETYHRYMHHKKGWEYHPTSAQHYYSSFVAGAEDFGYEVLYFDDEKLIGVDLIDILEDGISSIYFYYDPDYTQLSLGKLSLYYQIILAKNSNKKWIYLGYYVKDCPSLAYKASYKPYLTLQGSPGENEEAIWS